MNYNHPLSAVAKATLIDEAGRNDATTREITYLLHAFTTTNNPAYRRAAERGIRYLLKMQYPNGGFPQFYPDLSSYHHQITYNDDAMIRVLKLLRTITERTGDYASIDQNLRAQAQQAVERGIACILKTQYVQHGKLTAWCAQYDEKTLQPAKARNFELPSLSGSESVGIVEFLMDIDHPSPAVKRAINSAVAWFNEVKITGYTVRQVPDATQPKGYDRVMVPEPGATIWARFYDLETNKPIYVGRNSVRKNSLAEIEYERRTGYGYAGTWPAQLLAKKYPEWQKKWASQ